jgi:tetratricopeptide (TPR) repeat protein
VNSLLANSFFFCLVANRIEKREALGWKLGDCSLRMIVLFLTLSGLVLVGCQGESARWQFAHAQRLLEQGQPEEALKRMRVAVAKSDEHWELAIPFALELAQRQDSESIAICDRLLNQEQVQAQDGLLRFVRQTKVSCQSRLGDFEGALQTLKIIHRDRVERNKFEENELAYHRALANQELDLAYLNISNAIQSIASDWCCGERLELVDRTIVASALLSRYLLEESRRDSTLESAADAEKRIATALSFLNRSIARIEDKHGKHIPCEYGDTSEVNLARCIARSNLAVLLTVRALILQDLGMDASDDRLRASQSSKDFQKVLQNLPNEAASLELLGIAAPVLDTRGFIKSKINWWQEDFSTPQFSSYESALEDLDAAIFACQVERRALLGQLGNNVSFSVKRVNTMEQILRRSEAVLRYHRLMTHERGGDFQRAKTDRIEIEKLGFAINHQLH